ncbi:MAG: hypothetical protein QW279_08235 [Candidatus Jordarchaeaceae archaeon]
MAVIEISDYKMLDEAPYESPDPKALTELIIRGVKAQEKIYGPVFSAKVIDYSTRLIAKQRGEEPVQDIKDLDQLAEYLLSKSDKMPPYWVVLWAQFVTEKKLEGGRGVGTRMMDTAMFEKMMENVNSANKNVEIGELLSDYRRIMIERKIAPRKMGYKKNEDESINILYQDCYFLDACNIALHDEDILKRRNGRMACGFFGGVCLFLKKVTGSEWEYQILKFEKPNCLAKCFPL